MNSIQRETKGFAHPSEIGLRIMIVLSRHWSITKLAFKTASSTLLPIFHSFNLDLYPYKIAPITVEDATIRSENISMCLDSRIGNSFDEIKPGFSFNKTSGDGNSSLTSWL